MDEEAKEVVEDEILMKVEVVKTPEIKDKVKEEEDDDGYLEIKISEEDKNDEDDNW